MTEPLISILLPHLRNPENDAALRICLDCLVTHTDIDYELLVEGVAERRDIYAVINAMAKRASADWLVFWNSDVFCAVDWIRPLYDARELNTIVSPVMVECGAIPVNDRNLERDFGRRPETFRRDEFEAFVLDGGGWKEWWREDEEAWYFPSLINRNMFNWMGGFDTTRGSFPLIPLDIYFWDKWQQAGKHFRRVKSFIYHLQCFSETGRGVRE